VAKWFTPPEVARERGIRLSKVLHWIHSGELEAVNHATGVLGRPRWRVSSDALEQFDLARSNRSRIAPPRPTRTRKQLTDVIPFF